MSVVMTGVPRQEREEKLPKQWAIKDVEHFTGLEVVNVDMRANWVVCTLSNGVRFSFRKW